MARVGKASTVGLSQVQMERARERAEARAEQKASRAAAMGVRLPKRRKKGWELLKERLHLGLLMPALRQIEMNDPEIRKAQKATGISAFAHLAAKMSTKSFMLTGADEKRLMLDVKAEHEKGKRIREEREQRRKLIKRQKKLERELEYLNFPTIMGLYFDGFFTPYFQLKYEWAMIFNQMELEISKSKENSVKETFAEKAKRYFWPPDIIGGLCFRTRGIYLDFEDILKDPPHTPPDIVLDQRMEAVTLFTATERPEEDESRVASDEEEKKLSPTDQEAAEEERLEQMLRMIDLDEKLTEEEKAQKKKALTLMHKSRLEQAAHQQSILDEYHFKAISRNDYYFDDQLGAFFRKRGRDKDKYYYDSQWGVWRIKRKINMFPHDYYWDEQLAMFFPKDRSRQPNFYTYDPMLGVYRVTGDKTPPNWRGVKPTHFYFDHRAGKWVKKSSAPAGVVPYLDNNGMRFVANKNKDTPDDFFFDVKTQTFERKIPDPKLYHYDPHFGAWRKIGEPYPDRKDWRPSEFYWNEKENCFMKKDAPASFFSWDQNNKFFRKKISLHGRFHPKNWVWSEKKKMWELKKGLGRQEYMSQSLYWLPDRDYDKPWLEYFGGFKDFHSKYEYDRYMEEAELYGREGAGGPGGVGGQVTYGPGGVPIRGAGPGPGGPVGPGIPGVSRSEPTVPIKGILAGTADTTATGATTTTTTAATTTTTTTTTTLGPKLKGVTIEGAKPEPETTAETLMFVDTLDRKVLKVTGLGDKITDVDLRKYFASVKKVIRPKIPGSDFNEDYAYLKFNTEEAAAAALKTMHEQLIKGTQIFLRYKLKAEDETRGGQRDVGAEKQK